MTPAERRATKAHIRHFVADAVARKAWAATKPRDWNASTVSRDMLAEIRQLSVRQLARKAMAYARYRAFMPGPYAGWPADKPVHDLWHALREGTPARFYDWATGAYATRVGGAAA